MNALIVHFCSHRFYVVRLVLMVRCEWFKTTRFTYVLFLFEDGQHNTEWLTIGNCDIYHYVNNTDETFIQDLLEILKEHFRISRQHWIGTNERCQSK